MPPTDVEVPPSIGAPKLCPKPNPRNNHVMFKIFQNVQYNVVQHKKYVKEMIKLYKKLDEDLFRESFKNALQYLFTFGDTSANVDRVIQFVATFCTSLDDEEEFLLFICEIIFECQCVSGQSVRYRASQLLAAVLSALGEDASLDDDLCEKLLASQMQRLQDTRGAVRCRAALALQRLQNPMENSDDVTRAYRFHMSCDPSSSVRRAVVMSIAKCTRNVPFVLERLCDVDEAVRRAAFLHISAINVTQLRVRQRVLTLKVGLTERSPRVRRVVEEILIPAWLATFQGNIIDLLKSIRLDNVNDAKDSQYVAGKLLESLFKRLAISELLEWLPTEKSLRLIPAAKLNKETAWYWRHLAQHLQRIDDDETLETVVPDLVVLTGYIRAIVESPCPSETDDPVGFSTRQYVLYELGEMLSVYDATDPASRNSLHQLITDVLTGDYGPLNSDVIRAFVSALELVVPEVSSRLDVIGLIITSLRDAPEPEVTPALPPPPVESTEIKLQRARLRVSLNVAMEAQEEAVREQNYALAAECKAKVDDLHKQLEELNTQIAPPPPPQIVTVIKEKSDPPTLNKCLTILNCALDTPQLKTITPKLEMIFKALEVEIFENPEVLENALETVALYGMLDKKFAEENKVFFFANLIDTSKESTVSVVLRCIVDLLCVHGLRVFEQDSETDTSKKHNTTAGTNNIDDDGTLSESALSMSLSQNHNTLVEILLKFLDCDCATYRQIVVEGLCRLLHLGHLESPIILSRLLLLWFNPATVDEDMLRQIIGVFFQTFPVSVDGAQEQIQKATVPTLKTLANAPSSSPLAEIDQEDVVRFIVSLTRVNHELVDSQGGMATVLCHHIARRPAAAETGLACRMLALLSSPRDVGLASSLAVTLRDLCLKLPDKQSCRNLTRYLGALEATERASLNKMSHTGITEGTMQEDSLALARSSLPQPIARSTHVVINETVPEEVEIDETSPTEDISRITGENPEPQPGPSSPKSIRNSSETDTRPAPNSTDLGSDSSEDVSPVKKAKISKGKTKKLSINRQTTDSDSSKSSKGKEKQAAKASKAEAAKTKDKADSYKETEPSPQTSPPTDLDSSNVTVRRSIRGAQSGSSSDGSGYGGKKGKKPAAKKATKAAAATKTTRASTGSNRSSTGSYKAFDDSDESLHTVIYEKDFEQSVLNDSNELAQDNSINSQANVTTETAEAYDGQTTDSESSKSSKGKKKQATKGKPDDNEKGNEKASAEGKQAQEDRDKGVKRSRSQRSLVDVDRAQKAKAEAAKSKHKADSDKETEPSPQTSPPSDLDASNVTVRRSIRGAQSGSSSDGSGHGGKKGKKPAAKKAIKAAAATRPTRTSTGSNRSSAGSYKAFDDSDESLHTIVYEKEFVQSVLNDSSELAENSKINSKANVTIPETPEASDESETEPEPKPTRGKKNGKKK